MINQIELIDLINERIDVGKECNNLFAELSSIIRPVIERNMKTRFRQLSDLQIEVIMDQAENVFVEKMCTCDGIEEKNLRKIHNWCNRVAMNQIKDSIRTEKSKVANNVKVISFRNHMPVDKLSNLFKNLAKEFLSYAEQNKNKHSSYDWIDDESIHYLSYAYERLKNESLPKAEQLHRKEFKKFMIEEYGMREKVYRRAMECWRNFAEKINQKKETL